ncbi:MAG: hypothetical protein ACRYG7_02115, partial [Janthinobacterium lividum]
SYLVRGRLPAGFAASMTGESYFLRVHFYPTTSKITPLCPPKNGGKKRPGKPAFPGRLKG